MQIRQRNLPCIFPVGLDRMTQTERGARNSMSGPIFRAGDCGRRA